MQRQAIVVSTTTAGLGVIRALGMRQVPVVAFYYDDGDIGYASKYVTESVLVPHPQYCEEQFLESLLESSARFRGSVLIPTSDAALVAISRHKRMLEAHYIVACPDWRITERFLDKKHTYPLAEAAGVAVPYTMPVRSLEDVFRADTQIEYPCLMKPSQGHRYHDLFKRKMVRVENRDQMIAAYKQAAVAGLEMLVQELIPGPDSAGAVYNSYWWDGEPHAEFTAQKIRNAPPAFGSPRVSVSKQMPEVIELGRRILKVAGYSGYSCMEFKKDLRSGVYKLMEVNARHNLSSLLAVRCGLNFPWLQYDHLANGNLAKPFTWQAGIYWIDFTRDVGNSLRFYGNERYSLREYSRPYVRPHVFADLDANDPKPFVRKCLNLVTKSLQAAHLMKRNQWTNHRKIGADPSLIGDGSYS